MDAQEWLTTFADRLGLESIPQEDIEALLELASIAAHTSERLAAPLTCYLVGRAGVPAAEARAIAEEISQSAAN